MTGFHEYKDEDADVCVWLHLQDEDVFLSMQLQRMRMITRMCMRMLQMQVCLH